MHHGNDLNLTISDPVDDTEWKPWNTALTPCAGNHALHLRMCLNPANRLGDGIQKPSSQSRLL
jgi:hypothetical protein